MDYINNAINFIINQKFNEETIIEDIDKTFKDKYYSKNNELTDIFFEYLDLYLSLKREEVIRFANTINMKGIPSEYRSILEYYNMPFRYSKCPLADKKIFENITGLDDIGIDQVVFALLRGYHENEFNNNQDFINYINYFYNAQQITFNSIGKSQRMGWIGAMPLSVDDIIKDYLSIKNNKYDIDYNKKLGNYGELMFYRYLINNCCKGQQIMWVSRDLGDGFGYDIAVYDANINKLFLYEVKTTGRKEEIDNVSLNSFETRICNLFHTYEDTEYHIIRIYIGENIQIYDIDDKTSKIENIFNYNGKKSIDRHIYCYK